MLPETTAHKLKGTKIRILASHGYKSAIEFKNNIFVTITIRRRL